MAQLPEQVMQDLRTKFNKFDKDKNGHITSRELGEALKLCGESVPGYKLREMINSIDQDMNGTVEFNEFVQIYTSVNSRTFGKDFRQTVEKVDKIENVQAQASTDSAEGTTHTVSTAEYSAFADWISTTLHKDDFLVQNNYLPIDRAVEKRQLFQRCSDGILLCKLINHSVKDTIDERAINFKKLDLNGKQANQMLVRNSASAIGCTVINIKCKDLIEGRDHLVLGLLWQIIRVGLFAKINLKDCPQLSRLIREGENKSDLLKLSSEEMLLRWFNHHLEACGSQRRIKNFSGDIKDSECYIALLKQISSSKYALTTDAMKQADMNKRAQLMLNDAEKIGCRHFVTAKDVCQGSQKLNLAFVATLFHAYPALQPIDGSQDTANYVETREENTFRNWMNSLGVNPFVNHLLNDVANGCVLFQLLDNIKPGTVNWDKVNRPPFKVMGGKMKKIENCNYVMELGLKLKYSLEGVSGQKICDGNKASVLDLIWQMMRDYTLSKSGMLTGDKGIIEWVNNTLQGAHKTSKISAFNDSTISNSKAVLDLIDAIEPNSINYQNVCNDDTEAAKLLNAKYAISMARKIGASVYALPQDLVEVKPKMVMTVFVCLKTAALIKTGK